MTLPEPSTLDIESYFCDGIAFVAPRGVLDLASYPQLRDALLKLAVAGPRAVLVDVDELSVPTDATLVVFSSVWLQMSEWPGVPIMLIATHAADRDRLLASAVSRFVPVHADLAAALVTIDEPPARRRTMIELARGPECAVAARRFMLRICRRWRCLPVLADATLVASELVENAYRHAGGDPQLRLELREDRLTVAVYDDSPHPVRLLKVHTAGDTHLGLVLVDRLARTWGSAPTLAGGKVVWAVLMVPTD